MRSGVALAALTLGMVVPVLCVAFAGEVAVGVVMAWAAYTVGSTVVLGPAYDAAYRADLRRRHVGGAA